MAVDVKALLIQGAEDQGNPGPDFQFGYGRINIQNTIDIIRADDGTTDLIKEDMLSPAETWEYDIDVAGGGPQGHAGLGRLRGRLRCGGTMLVNDLDLELEAPGGGIYHPWVLNPEQPEQQRDDGRRPPQQRRAGAGELARHRHVDGPRDGDRDARGQPGLLAS